MSSKRREPPPSKPISMEWEGKQYTGSYTVDRGMVEVRLNAGPFGSSKATQVGSTPEEEIAWMLLSELVTEHLDKEKERQERAARLAKTPDGAGR